MCVCVCVCVYFLCIYSVSTVYAFENYGCIHDCLCVSLWVHVGICGYDAEFVLSRVRYGQRHSRLLLAHIRKSAH